MATGDVTRIIRMPAQLCYNATNLNNAFPHGGTAIGMAREIVFNFGYKTQRATSPVFGGQTNKVYYQGEEPYLAAVLRDWDNDALNAIFPNSIAGTISQDRMISYLPGDATVANRPGYDLAGKVVRLCVSPLSRLRHPFILIYYAFPAVEETAKLNAVLTEEVGLGTVWWAGTDTSGRCYRIGKAADLQSAGVT